MTVSEFDLIRRYFCPDQPARHDVLLSIGDDAALLQVPSGMELAVSMDTLVTGVHFPEDTDPYAIGFKAMAVNLSDMAAMGAQPAWVTLSMTLPEPDHAWLQSFSRGFFEMADHYDVRLVGGDTSRGALSITVQMHGFVPAGRALRRDRARPGDRVYVTGTLGDAGLGLQIKQQHLVVAAAERRYLLQRLERPQPRIAAGLALRGLAHAAIDISDGLIADLAHICDASRVGATIDVEKIPLSFAFRNVTGAWREEQRSTVALSAGDDYELCFTVASQQHMDRIADLECCCVGRIEAEAGVRCRLDGRDYTPSRQGFDHFSGIAGGEDQA